MTRSELEKKLKKSLEFLKSELSQIRTGRANPSLLEDVEVEAYDSIMTLKELGSITLSDAQTIIVTPWDKNLIQDIEKAIRESEAGLNPIEVGGNLKVPIPALTEERRKEMVKVVNQKVEETRQAIRNIRKDAMKDIETRFEDKEISEDDKFRLKEEVDDLIKEFTDKAEKTAEDKSKDLMAV